MSLSPLSVDDVVFIYATLAVDAPIDGGPVFDEHRHIRQLSWMQNNTCTHLIIRPDTPEGVIQYPVPNNLPGPIRIWTVPTEVLALHRFWEAMNVVAEYPSATIIGGWRLRNDLWPTLVLKGLRSNARIDPCFRTDLLSKYSTIKTLLDVSDIYTQGAHPALRALPSIADALAYLGVQQVYPRDFHVDPEILMYYTPDEWNTRGYFAVTNYLCGMQSAVRQYYT